MPMRRLPPRTAAPTAFGSEHASDGPFHGVAGRPRATHANLGDGVANDLTVAVLDGKHGTAGVTVQLSERTSCRGLRGAKNSPALFQASAHGPRGPPSCCAY